MNKRPLALLLISVFISMIILESSGPTWGESNSPKVLDENGFVVQKIVDNLDEPSGFEFVGKNDVLVTQKTDGKVKLVRNFDLKKYSVLDINVFNHTLDSGISGTTSASVGNLTYFFLFYTENSVKDDSKISHRPNGNDNAVYRYIWDPTRLMLSNSTLLLDLPSSSAENSGRGIIIMGPDNQLYTALGDLESEGLPQNVPEEDSPVDWLFVNKSESGAILRTTIDGEPSNGNPFRISGFERFYGFGIKDIFAMAFDPVTGFLWDLEQGPSGMQEINQIKPRYNGSWNETQGVSNEILNIDNINSSLYHGPKFVSHNLSSSLSTLLFVNNSAMGEEYINELFVGDSQGKIYRFDLDRNRDEIIVKDSLADHIFATGFGSISDMKIGPDNALYVLTVANNTAFPLLKSSGEIYRIAKDKITLPLIESRAISADYMGLIGIVIVCVAILIFLKYSRKNSRIMR